MMPERRRISIHVLRVEDDSAGRQIAVQLLAFQSTSSVWRTTLLYIVNIQIAQISIHVLRVEDDAGRTVQHPAV